MGFFDRINYQSDAVPYQASTEIRGVRHGDFGKMYSLENLPR